MNFGFLPTLGLKMVSEVSGADRRETEEMNAELQNSFIRHATDVMQNTQDHERENSKSRKPSRTSPC